MSIAFVWLISYSFLFLSISSYTSFLRSFDRIRLVLFNRIIPSAAGGTAVFPPVARAVEPRLDAIATQLARLVDVSRAVHTHTYNRLIAAVVARAGGVGVGGQGVAA